METSSFSKVHASTGSGLSHGKKIRVLVVDDSPLMRQLITKSLSLDPGIEVVGSASDPFMARDQIKQLNPDVITLDINMPRMDGLSFLEKIMTLRPMPVVMISTLTERGAKETIDALELGAVDYVTKPTHNVYDNFEKIALEICEKVRTASKANIKRLSYKAHNQGKTTYVSPASFRGTTLPQLVVMGASTGGVEALSAVFASLPARCPPIVVVQHMPPGFTKSFAMRMDRQYQPTVLEAVHQKMIESGHIYIAPGDQHVHLVMRGGKIFMELSSSQGLVSGHKPSVDVLFESAVSIPLRHKIGILLTGMGKDGAKGLLQLRQSGTKTFTQNEETSLVYGMPRAAKEMGASDHELPLSRVANIIMGYGVDQTP